MKKDIRSMTMEELQDEAEAMGQPPFRAGQIFPGCMGKKQKTLQK